ncbi:GCN5-related N-acetyltransferase [Coriobacterium glomerans PW2]|uniref:GCN5-related N-acetyltransferase n=1 Tax=Coriobacterium glomerans (strain ATCC 49209 / DSM 20642 / JCM 10262 / PW2) TaxID=700015 RepID=F2NAA9_CORGP|nr:GNAT family N-acetyltransferase [Coriobacterium glomerans]AEB06295.1 GCN5-related N-acetyltransferase [Coriobacterium glomerans PW2]
MKLCPWTDRYSDEVTSWRYPPPYDLYNLPSLSEMVSASLGFADPGQRQNFTGVECDGALVGFFNLQDCGDTVFLGIGVRPDACSKGYGTVIMRAAIEESRRRFATKPIELDVREWNERAIRCYEKAGFTAVGSVSQETYAGEGVFVRMRYEFG